jgi:hypothetical protein
MRVAVCGWGAVRGDVHESAGRGVRRERERSASAEGGQGARRRDGARPCVRARRGEGVGAERRPARGWGVRERVRGVGSYKREPERVEGGPD